MLCVYSLVDLLHCNYNFRCFRLSYKMTWSRQAVLSLYKSLLRKSSSLKHTNKDWYVRKVKQEFADNACVTSQQEKEFLLRVTVCCI